MGALYIIGAMVLAGLVKEAIAAVAGDGKVAEYDYHFASGVGAVFGTRG